MHASNNTLKYILIILLFTRAFSTNGQSVAKVENISTPAFSNIGTKQGLSNRAVTEITQDAQGSIWVATVDGVNRLDGYRVKQFFNTPEDKNGLFNSDRGAFNAGYTDKLYIANQAGLACYNLASGKFEILDQQKKTNLQNQKRIKLYKQADTLWVFGHEKHYKLLNNKVIEELNYSGNSSIIDTVKHAFTNYLMQVRKDVTGNLWAVNTIYLMKINPKTMRVTAHYKILENGTGYIQDLEIIDNKVYVCTWGKGLIQLDVATNNLKTIANVPKICKDASVYVDANNNKCLVIAGDPTNSILNLVTGKVASVSGVTAGRTAFVDNANTIWLGTDNGVYYSNVQNKYIKNINLKELIGSANAPTEGYMPNLFFIENNIQYVATAYSGGLIQFDKKWNYKNIITNFGSANRDEGFKDIRSIYNVANVNWVASKAGLSKCDANLRIIKHFTPQYSNPNVLRKNVMNKIIPIGDNKLFLKGFMSLHIFDTQQETFTKSYYNSVDGKYKLANDYIGKCLVQGDTVFMATDEGLKILNLRTGVINTIDLSLTEKAILDIIKIDDTIWLATLHGMIRLELKTLRTKLYTRESGLASNNVRHILQGKGSLLWVATANGLSAFNTKTNTFTNFSDRDGLIDNVLEFGFGFDADSNIAIGHVDNISIVDPNIITSKNNVKKTIITEIMVNGVNAHWEVKDKHKEINLTYKQNIVSLYFSIIGVAAMDANTYYYKLNNSAWMQGATGQILLNNLAPGTYTVSVSNMPKDALKNDFIILHIAPPFYNTGWFYLLCALLLGTLIYALFRYRANTIRQQLQTQKAYELKLQNLEMQSLRSQMNPHFIFNTLNSINSFIIQNHTELASEYLTKFSKLMRNILDHSKQETVSLRKELQTLTMYLNLESVRLEHKFDYNITVDKSIAPDAEQVPSLIIQPFVENALWHGLHNKIGNGYIQIDIEQKAEGVIVITITDNGIGRAKAGALKQEQVQHKSYGIEITTNRLKLLNTNNSIITTDLYDANNQASGTQVEIILNQIVK